MKYLLLLIISISASLVHSKEITSIDDILIKNIISRDQLNSKAKNFRHKDQLDLSEYNHPQNGLAQFDYEHSDIISINIDKKKTNINKHYSAYEGSIHALVPAISELGSNLKIDRLLKFKFLKPKHLQGSAPLMIVLPPIMGNTMVDKGVAVDLAKNGAFVILPDIPSVFSKDSTLEQVVVELMQNIILNKMIIEYALENQDIDKEHIGIFGVSSGAVLATTMAGIMKEVNSVYLLAGGGNLANISTKSKRDSVKAYRDNEYKNNHEIQHLDGLEKVKAWQKLSSKAFRNIDPLYYAKNIDPKKVFMVMSTNDETIPFENQVELWNELGQPNYRLSALNHINTIVRWKLHSSSHAVQFLLDTE